MTDTKSFWQSKTLWLAILQAFAGVIAVVIANRPELGGALILKSIVDAIIRFNTDTAIS